MAYIDEATPAPDEADEARAAEGTKPMDEEEIQATVQRMIEEAQQFVEEDLSPHRAEATRYYKGEPFGNEEDGRSQFIATEVKDTIGEIMPSLMRVFLGPVRSVEFRPEGAEQVQMAEHITEYITKVVLTYDNNGFLVFHSWFKDALVKRLGFVKWWCEEKTTTTEHEATGLTPEALLILQSDPTITVDEVEPEAPTAEQMPPTATVSFTRTATEKKIRVAAVPPEELLFNRTARDFEDALIVVHRTQKTRSELLEMGISAEVLDEHGGAGDRTNDEEEETARRNYSVTDEDDDSEQEATRLILYCEAYPYLDTGSGTAELRRVCTVGEDYYIVENEVVDERPFAYLCPDPEPHTIEGLSPADATMDLQKMKSMIFRSMADSLAQSIFSRIAVVEGQVSMEDVLNTEIGAPIRMTAPGMVQPLNLPFVGKEAFPMLEYVDAMRERRVPAPPLNVDALQSSTKAAVAASVSASQQKVELIARIFAETGVKRLFRGLLKLIVKHQPGARMVRLRGEWVALDPRTWNAELDVSINIALGSGLQEEKVAVLMQTAAKQEQYLQTLGPDNPLVGLPQLRRTLGLILELSGRQDADTFFKPIPDNWTPPPAPPAPPDPNMMIAQAEMAKAQAEVQKKQAEFQLKMATDQQTLQVEQAKLQLQAEGQANMDDRERDRMEADILLRAKEIEAKYQTQVNIAEIKAAVERDRDARGARKRRVKTSRDAEGKLTAEIEEVEE